MVEEARCTPTPHNRGAYLRAGIFILIGVLGYAVASLLPAYGGAVQLVALVLTVAGVFTLTKYALVKHSYLLVRTEEGKRYFLVEQTQGRRKSTLCTLSLSEVVAIYDYADREKAIAYGGRMYSYTASSKNCSYQTVVARTALGRVAVRIEADPPFISALRRAVYEERSRSDGEEE
jgi:hypothetical protein